MSDWLCVDEKLRKSCWKCSSFDKLVIASRHLLEPFVGHNQSTHGQKKKNLEIMGELLFTWNKSTRGVAGSVLHLSNQL